jgi:hypothetical protein
VWTEFSWDCIEYSDCLFPFGEGGVYDASSTHLECFGKDLQGSEFGLLEVLSWNLSEGTGENHEAAPPDFIA